MMSTFLPTLNGYAKRESRCLNIENQASILNPEQAVCPILMTDSIRKCLELDPDLEEITTNSMKRKYGSLVLRLRCVSLEEMYSCPHQTMAGDLDLIPPLISFIQKKSMHPINNSSR